MKRAFLMVAFGAVLIAGGLAFTNGSRTQETTTAGRQESDADVAPAPEISLAQGGPAQSTETGQTAPSARPQAVDETALRYFARSGDTRRLEAEIARLRALYPDWTPPENPLDVPAAGDPELDRMWELYAEGRYAEVREAVAARQASETGWQPPSDLLDRLAVAEARQRLVNASNLQQYETVVRVASETPSLLTCSEVDILWRVARAFAETERLARSLDAYRYILTNCDDAGERLATVQMASQQLDRDAVDELLALERESAEGIGEFASVRLDLARSAVAAAGEDEEAESVSADDVARLAASVEETGSASDLLLLGWYQLTHGDPADAEDFFRRSSETEESPEATRGLALALLELDEVPEAEEIARAGADSSAEARAVYAAAAANLLAQDPMPTLSADQLAAMVAVTAALGDAELAQQLGWYAYGANQFATAGQWFETALAWKPDEEPAAFGLALVSERLGDASGLQRIQASWGATSPRIAAMGRTLVAGTPGASTPVASGAVPGVQAVVQEPAPSPAQAPSVAPSAAQPQPEPAAPARRAVPPSSPTPVETTRPVASAAPAASRAPRASGCRSTLDPRTLSPEAALTRGWCLMEIDRPLEAAPAFEVALLSSSENTRRDAAYGQSLAYLRAGLADRAAVAASKAPQTRERQLELEVALLTDQATGAFEAGRPVETLMALDERARIAPERLDLMVLRGYAYLDLRRFSDAERVFKAVARAGSSEGARGLNATREAQGYFAGGG